MQTAGDGEDGEVEDLDDEVDSFQLEKCMKDRRRVKSLPATLEGIPANGERKRVKFADSMGLNLASVKHFNTLEEPQIPTKVMSTLRRFPRQPHDFLGDLCGNFTSSLTLDRLVRCFPEPADAGDVEARVQVLRVCLEKVTITRFDVRGQIRVFTTCSKREVGVRYTFNDWLTYVDAQALHAAADQPQPRFVGERFIFTMFTPPCLGPGSSVDFAVYLKSDEGDFWDNNEGKNYTLKCQCASSTPAHFAT